MKPWKMMAAGLAVLILIITAPFQAMAGSVEKIKQGTREAVSEVKKEAIRAGKAAAESGREMKAGAVKSGANIKAGVKEVGRDIKKAFLETKAAVTREFSGDARD